MYVISYVQQLKKWLRLSVHASKVVSNVELESSFLMILILDSKHMKDMGYGILTLINAALFYYNLPWGGAQSSPPLKSTQNLGFRGKSW